MSLNEPVGFNEQVATEEWTPQRGLRRGWIRGGVVAALLFGVLTPLCLYSPYLLLPTLPRTLVTFGLAWVLIRTVESAAGMTGGRVFGAGLALTAVVLVAQHALFANFGVLSPGGFSSFWIWPMQIVEKTVNSGRYLTGVRWFHPQVLLIVNAPPLIFGGGMAALVSRDSR